MRYFKFKLFYALILSLILFSCKEKYDVFSEEDQSFFTYQIGDSIRLRHNKTNDTLKFKVVDSYLTIVQDPFTQKKNYEQKDYLLESINNTVALKFRKTSSKSDRVFNIEFSFVGDTSSLFYVNSCLSNNKNELQIDIDVDGSHYVDLYKFQSKYANSNQYSDDKFVLYSKDYGIVQLNNPDNNETYTLIK